MLQRVLCLLLAFTVGGISKAAEVAGRPPFSWDTVPIYIHVGKADGFSNEEIARVADRSDFVCLEKGHGASRHGSTEKGTIPNIISKVSAH